MKEKEEFFSPVSRITRDRENYFSVFEKRKSNCKEIESSYFSRGDREISANTLGGF